MSHTRRRFYSEPFPQRNLSIEQVLKVLSTQKTFDTRTLCIQTAHRSFYRPTYACRNFTQNSFYTADFFGTEALTHLKKKHGNFYKQKVLRTEVLRKAFFTYRRVHTQTHLYGCLYTDTNCTQNTFAHSQLLHSKALFPLLDHLPFVFPLKFEFNALKCLGS